MGQVELTVGPRANLTPTGRILPNTTWSMNGTWTISENQEYVLIAQLDGNLVLYQVLGTPPQKEGDILNGESLWATGTDVKGTVELQNDGNYVVYDSSHAARWASNTAGTRPVDLLVQNDGNLVLYKTTSAWASGTVRGFRE